MTEIERVSDLEEAIHVHEAVAVLFTRDDSPESVDLKPRVRRLLRRFPNIRLYHVGVDRHPTAASEFLVYEVPTIIVYYRGKPFLKHVGGFYLPDLREELGRFAAKQADGGAPGSD
ncbi:MAG: thioredoxin family protein [Spirochaetaceae bacterium]